MTDKKIKTAVKIEEMLNSQQKITVTVTYIDAKSFLNIAKKKIISETEVKGFRKGQMPEDLFIKQFGSFPIYQELAYNLVDKTYTDVLIENKIQAIGRPEIGVLDFGEDKDVIYEMIVDVMPKVILGNYMKLHSEFPEVKSESVTDFDVEEALKEIVTWRKNKQSNSADKLSKEGEIKPENTESDEVTEEDVKAMGIDSGKIEDLKIKLKENLQQEKDFKNVDIRRNQVLNKLINETLGDMPKSFIENEIAKIKNKIEGDLQNMGITFVDYLKHLNKTESEWVESEKPQAEKNAKLQIALLEISKKENVAPSKEAIEAEVNHMKLHYADVNEQRLREYCIERMTNTFVLEYVMTGKLPDEKELFKVDHDHS